LNHRIDIDGDPLPRSAGDGEVLLDALLRAGVPFAYSCQAGNCGHCKCLLIAGMVEELPYSEAALTPAQRAVGVVLACRLRVRGDLRLRRLP
jgi:ferredoxin